jgi:hypothetical protein
MFINSKNFLIVVGLGSLALGLLSFVGILGPTAGQSIFGNRWWLDTTQGFVHVILGVASIICGFALSSDKQRGAVWLLGAISVIGALVSLIFKHYLSGNLVEPVEEALYFTTGNLGLWVVTWEINKEQKKQITRIMEIDEIFKTKI